MNKLRDWISLKKINKHPMSLIFLSNNPNAIDLLEQNPDYINWTYLSENPIPQAPNKKRFGKRSFLTEKIELYFLFLS